MRPPLDPILIHITPTFGIHWYGVLIVSGIMLGALYAAQRAKQDGEDPEHIWNMLLLAIVLGIVGARLYHVFSSPKGGSVGWSYYRENPMEIFHIWKGGLGIYGAIIGGMLGVAIYTWRAKLSPLQWLDYSAPGLAIGQAIGRWGNFINQELYGPPTNSNWGLIIDPEHRIIPYNNLELYPPDTLFHPTFLYESIWAFLVFGTLALIGRKLKDKLLPGDIILGYLIGYPLGRFFIEFLRPDAWMMGSLAAAQVFALICVVGSTAVLVVRHVLASHKPAEPTEDKGTAVESALKTPAEGMEEAAEQ